MARRSILTGVLRFRSTLTEITSLLLVSNSIQAPRYGISLAKASDLPVVVSVLVVKYTPGERTNWLTTTRSAPFIMKVPVVVITGMSPIKRFCLFLSPSAGPGALVRSSTVTCRGAE